MFECGADIELAVNDRRHRFGNRHFNPEITGDTGGDRGSKRPFDQFALAPIGAVRKLLDAAHWSMDDVDLFEINEAFAAVAMAAERELGIPREKLNVFGGAVALGHPIGCSGTRILVTLLNALRRKKLRRGIACLCIGGGEAVAMAVETCE